MDPIIFNQLDPIQVPVKLGNTWYILLEASGGAAVQYRNAVLRSQRMDDGKLAGFDGLADAEPFAVSLCLYKAIHEGNQADGKPKLKLPRDKDDNPDPAHLVPEATIRGWNNRVQKVLFERLQEISELDDKGDEAGLVKQIDQLQKRLDRLREDAPKNGQHSTTAGTPSPKS